MHSRFAVTLLAFFAMLSVSAHVAAATYYTRNTNPVTWSLTNGGPNCGCTPDESGEIFVNHDVTIAGPFTIRGDLTIAEGVTLTVNGNLTFHNNSAVVIYGTLKVQGNFTNKNNSDDVDIYGTLEVSGSFTNENNGIIDLGPTAKIIRDPEKGCQSPGQITQNGNVYTSCNVGPLPVQLIFFRAEQTGSEVFLTWATASEKNFEHFSIERADEQLIWEEIGTVSGSGTTQTRVDYNYTDRSPGMVGFLYYRLKAIDFDGYTEYFQIAAVNYRAPKAWYISPNPASSGEIVLMRNFAEDEVVQATLYSMSGSQVLQEQISVTTDRYVIATKLNAGVYILKLRHRSGTRNLRFAVE